MKILKSLKIYLLLTAFATVVFMIGCGSNGKWLSNDDVTAPIVTAVIPLNNADNFAINGKIIATFSESINISTINVSSFRVVNDTGTLVSGLVDYVESSRVATFTPDTNLAANSRCTATITTAIKDLAGNAMATNFVWSFKTSATVDTTAPIVFATINVNGDTNVPINTQVGVTFSEPMDPLTLTTMTFTLKKTSDSSAVSGLVTYSGVNAIFAPATTLAPNTQYTANITTGVKDIAGNAMSANYTWSWTTGALPDTTAPAITFIVPANNATNVSINIQTLSATFTEKIDPLTLTALTFNLKETLSGNNVIGILSYDLILLSNIATFQPTAPLAPDRQYTVTVTTGVKDLAGNPMASNFVWLFTTAATPDSVPPTVIATINANGDTNVPINTQVGVTFSEPMDPLTLTTTTFTLKKTSDSSVVSGLVTYSGVNAIFAPATTLAPNTQYTANITTGVKDIAGNTLAVNYTWNWTTGAISDTAPPIVTLVIPSDSATGVSISIQTISASFNEKIDPATLTSLTFTLKETLSGNNVMGTLVYDLILLSNIATFRPSDTLVANTKYSVTITTGVKDLAGNALTSNYVWTFTTGAAPDIIAPRIIASINSNGDTDVPINTQVGVTFSESMDPLTITPLTFILTKTSDSSLISGLISYSGVNALFTPDTHLAINTLYTVRITTGVKDIAGNSIVADTTWNWTTGNALDLVPPTITLVNPVADTIGVYLNKTIAVTFSEVIDPLTITNLTFNLKKTSDSSAVAGNMVYDQILLSNIAAFKPINNLNPLTQYTVTVTTGVKDLGGNQLLSDSIWIFTTGSDTAPEIELGSAITFAVFGGGSGITNEGIYTVVNGDMGTTGASSTIVAFYDSVGDHYGAPDGRVNGRIYTDAPPPGGAMVGGTLETMAIATQARSDANTAWVSLSPAKMPGGIDLGNNQLGGRVLAPGIYQSASGTYEITGSDLTLDAQGDPNAVFVFQMGSSLTVGGPGAPRTIHLIRGAQAKNVYWQVGSSAEINAAGGGVMVGTIISSATTTFSTSGNTELVIFNGRALALNAAVTMVNTVINMPAQ